MRRWFGLNNQTSTEPEVLWLIRKLVLLTPHYNILFKAINLPSKSNVLSSSVLRLQISKFKTMKPVSGTSNYNSRFTNIDKLKHTVGQLIDSSLANSTKCIYDRVRSEFRSFSGLYLSDFDAILPVFRNTMSLF